MSTTNVSAVQRRSITENARRVVAFVCFAGLLAVFGVHVASASLAMSRMTVVGFDKEPHSVVVSAEPRNATSSFAIQVLLDEKKERLDQVKKYDERIRASIVLYLTAVIGAVVLGGIRLVMFGPLVRFADIRKQPLMTALVYFFIALNLAMLLQSTVDTFFAMANAKYIAAYLNPQIAKLTAAPSEALSWDAWHGDFKALAVQSREIANAMWFAIIAVVLLASLTLVETPPQLSWKGRTALVLVFLVLFGLTFCVVYLTILGTMAGRQFSSREINLNGRLCTLLALAIATALFGVGDGIRLASRRVAKGVS